MPQHHTGYIEVTSIPRGEVPRDVRAAWLGLWLPYRKQVILEDGEAKGTCSGIALPSREGFLVPQEGSLTVLKCFNTWAHRWWIEHHFPIVYNNFFFGIDEARIVIPAPPIVPKVWDDMEGWGADPNK